jgi:preprotein translocase subunit SecD
MIDKKYALLLVLFVAFLSLLVIYKTVNNFIMLVVLISFGYISFTSKDRNVKLAALALLFILSASNIYLNGIRWGIDFAGGTRIPVTLEKPVTMDVMQNIVNTLKIRTSTLGLEQVQVQAIGNDRIFIQVPSDNEQTLKRIESTISQQGVYKGVVDGQVVVSGTDILPGTIYQIPSSYAAQHGADWGVAFSITPDAAKAFAEKVRGKANYPLYMYLDMPSGATMVLNKERLSNITANVSSDFDNIVIALDEALDNGAGRVDLEYEENIPANLSAASANTTYIVEANTTLEKRLRDSGARVMAYSAKDLYPDFAGGTMLFVNQWKAIGLISAPVLSPDITKGSVSLGYTITGNAPLSGDSYQRQTAADNEAKSIMSVLKGGAFPVKLSAGSKTFIPAALGEKFLNYSVIAMLASLAIVVAFLAVRYRRLDLVLPMGIITVAELVILISIVGSFTIDLPAMAGIIASAGISVDAQIVITDELLRRDDKKDAIKRSFSIINNNALVAAVSMLPLFFVNVVEVVGFAVSSIFAYALGVMLSRPAYSAIVEDIFGKKGDGEKDNVKMEDLFWGKGKGGNNEHVA